MADDKSSRVSGTERLGVIMLAAGYGTRLQRDIDATPSLSMLAGLPKPLLPLGGSPILSHWLSSLNSVLAVEQVVVVTNEAHYSLYEDWAREARDIFAPDITVVSDGSTDNASRLGAIKDITIGLSALSSTAANKALVIAGDTLLPGVKILDFIASFVAGGHNLATFAYALADMTECSKRGMFEVQEESPGVLIATGMVEKPQSPAESPSDLASAPVYMLRKSIWGTFDQFLEERRKACASLVKIDAPGFWLSWLVPKEPCRLFKVQQRIDIGGLKHYMDALWQYSLPSEENASSAVQLRKMREPAVGRAYPRLGLLGNPSDGYGGKVIAVSIASEGYAEVVATPSEAFVVHPNPAHELHDEYKNLRHLVDHVSERGLHFSARKLVLAAGTVFARVYGRKLTSLRKQRVDWDGSTGTPEESLEKLPNCQLVYRSTIPVRIGLSGSSAIILATLRAMARFYNTSLEEIDRDLQTWPVLMQSAESDLLGISCGLMDRVIQVMQGCVAMDFTGNQNEAPWVRLPEEALPELWIAFCSNESVGECSGTVHGSLKARFEAKDPEIAAVVEQLRDVADNGREILEKCSAGDSSGLKNFPALVDKNFELRRKLVGDKSVGERNIKLVSAAREVGFAAKLTGSGGCALCIPNPIRKLTPAEVDSATSELLRKGFVLHRVEVLRRREWLV